MDARSRSIQTSKCEYDFGNEKNSENSIPTKAIETIQDHCKLRMLQYCL